MKNSAAFILPSFLLLLMVLASPPPAPAFTYVRVADSLLADQASVIAEVRVLPPCCSSCPGPTAPIES